MINSLLVGFSFFALSMICYYYIEKKLKPSSLIFVHKIIKLLVCVWIIFISLNLIFGIFWKG